MSIGLAITTAAAFNLVCTGTRTDSKIFDPNADKNQVVVVLRVDLDTKRWCAGDCVSTSAIHEVRDNAIIFKNDESASGDDVFIVNRESGEFIDRKRVWAIKWATLVQGSCAKETFTGFPAQKF